MPPHTTHPDLQSQLDNITAQTRALVQPERLAVTDAAIHTLLASGIESRILPVGAAAPGFALPAASATVLASPSSGKLIRSDDLLALGPLIINFFRGRWCPYCVTELEAWQALYPAVRERGALLVAISPQLPRQNDFLVQQHSLTFPVLTDTGCSLAAQFGIAYTLPEPMRTHLRAILINLPFIHGENKHDPDATWRLPLPATFVIKPTQLSSRPEREARSGEIPAFASAMEATIVFAEAHADHRVRPNPTDILRTL